MTEELETLKTSATANGTVGQSPAEPAAAEPLPAAAVETQPPSPPAAPDLESLRQKAAKADEYYDLFIRGRAEMDNFRKRAARERQEAIRFASQSLVEKLIPVLDNFEMAMTAVNNPGQANIETLKQGVSMVQNQLKSILGEAGVQEVDASGQAFNPNLHEAVSQMESADAPEGHVLQQLRKGYTLHERLIRPATVVVAKAPSA